MEMKKLQETNRILSERLNLLDKWLEKRIAGKWIGDYLKKQKINTVAVYGLGAVAERLLEELDKSGIAVTYIVERRRDLQGGQYDGIPVLSANLIRKYKDVQMIIVTPFHAIDKIKENIKKEIPTLHVKGINEIIEHY